MATWSDLNESETDSQDIAEDEEDDSNICLMAQSKENSDPKYVSDEDIIAEMEKLLKALKNVDAKINKLDHEVKTLKNEKEALSQINMLLADENDILKINNEKLHEIQIKLERKIAY